MDANQIGQTGVPAGSTGPATLLSRAGVGDLMLIALLWMLAVLIVRPVGEFPLNDDWSWGMTAKRLAEGKGYHPTGWTEMTLITNAVWGALFCLPGGFSFAALRCSTLVMSLAGALVMYALVLQLGRSRRIAMLCALILAFNPVYFSLSNTFMADVPFTTIALLCSLFFIRHLQNESDKDLILGSVFGLAATLSRQMGLCLPVAFGAVLWLRHGFRTRWIVRAALPALVSLVVLVAFQHSVKISEELPALNIRKQRLVAVLADPTVIPMNVFYFGWSMLMYLGWFLLPLAVLVFGRRRDEPGSKPSLGVRITLFLFGIISVARLIFGSGLMPVHNNVITPQGIGPETLPDLFVLHLPNLPALPLAFWIGITLLSLGGAGVLVWKMTRMGAELFAKKRLGLADPDRAVTTFLLLSMVIYLGPFLASGFFDRYLIPVAAFLALVFALAIEKSGFTITRSQALLAILFIALAAFYAVAGTRDYLEWNRVRWRALDALLAETHVHPKEVNGGFEFSGWHLFDNPGQTNMVTTNVTYIVTFGEVPGFEQVRSYPYRNWLPPGERHILVLKRQQPGK